MKKIFFHLFITSSLFFYSCEQEKTTLVANVPIESITTDFLTWWNYHNDYITFSSNFIAFDESSKKISKEEFLEQLTTGKFIPVKIQSKEIQYQLIGIDKSSKKNIEMTIKSVSFNALRYYRMEGKPFPNFSFKDIQGNEYNSTNTLGKKLVVKCWFINCTACVREFPELNQLVKETKPSDATLFLSLATDPDEKLRAFLSKSPFEYKVVGNQGKFIKDILQVSEYPTHIIVNEKGIITKVVTNSNDLITSLSQSTKGF